jgi:hypothetical protein
MNSHPQQIALLKYITGLCVTVCLCLILGFAAHSRTVDIMNASKGDGSLNRAAYGLDRFSH